jgi:hypothetical protein
MVTTDCKPGEGAEWPRLPKSRRARGRMISPGTALLVMHLCFSGAGFAANFCPSPPPDENCSRLLVQFGGKSLSDQNIEKILRDLRPFGVIGATSGLGSLPNARVLSIDKGVFMTPQKLRLLLSTLKSLSRGEEVGVLIAELSSPWGLRSNRPNDPFYRLQVPVLEEVHAPEAWERISKIPHSPAVVAVVDTGIRYDHVDLRDEMWMGNAAHGKNFSSTVADDTSDVVGHGTNVAGALAATTNNQEGVASIPWRNGVRLVIAKYSGEAAGQCTDDFLNAIDYAAIEANAAVINLSAGSNVCSEALGEELRILRDTKQRTLLVAAVDDDHPIDLDAPDAEVQDYPTAYHLKNIISVESGYSKTGLSASAYGRYSVQLAAPGDVFTTDSGDDHAYVSASGTSLAAPLVSATAALISSYAPGWRHEDIRQYLIDSARNSNCDPSGGPSDRYPLCGTSESGGVLDVEAATGAPVTLVKPGKADQWERGQQYQVSWQTKFKTNLCPLVDLYLSVDNGLNWSAPDSLHEKLRTQGDKSTVNLTIPTNVPKSSTARLALRCHGTERLERWSDTFTID